MGKIIFISKKVKMDLKAKDPRIVCPFCEKSFHLFAATISDYCACFSGVDGSHAFFIRQAKAKLTKKQEVEETLLRG